LSKVSRGLRATSLLLLALFIVWGLYGVLSPAPSPRSMTYGELFAALRAGRVQEVQVEAKRIVAWVRPAPPASAAVVERHVVSRVPEREDAAFLAELRQAKSRLSGEDDEGSAWFQYLVMSALPILLLLVLFFTGRRTCRRRSSPAAEAAGDEADGIDIGLSGRAMNEEEKRHLAYHEAGRAVVALSLPHAATDTLATRTELRDRLCAILGGRAAEELVCGEASTSAESDLDRAAETARTLIGRFGERDRLGALTYGGAVRIDAVRGEIETEQARAKHLLEEHREELVAIAERLLAEERLERADIAAIMASRHPRRAAAG
jgi:ATP-dependent Zn protease